MHVRIDISDAGAGPGVATETMVETGAASPIAAGQPQTSAAPEAAGAIDAGEPSAGLVAAVAAAGGSTVQPALATTNGLALSAGSASY